MDNENLAAVRAVEYLKTFVGVTIDNYHSGAGGVTAEVAKVVIGREIEKTLLVGDLLGAAAPVLRLRVEGAQAVQAIAQLVFESGLVVAALRCLGARALPEGKITLPVVYATLACAKPTRIADYIIMLEKSGATVRDWSYD